MRTLTVKIEHPSRKDTFRIHPLFDLHIGAKACNEKLIARRVKEIADDPNAYVILGGDQTNSIGRNDPRSNQYERAAWTHEYEDIHRAERTRMISLLRPVLGKIICVIEGNHETAPLRHDGVNVYVGQLEAIAAETGGDPRELALGTEGFIRLRFERHSKNTARPVSKVITIYAHHGWGGGRRKGGKINKLEDLIGAYDADLYLAGHTHEIAMFDKATIAPKAPKKPGISGVTSRKRIAIRCGTGLEAYMPDTADGYPRNSYGQRAGYAPTSSGWPVIEIAPGHNEITVSLSGVMG